jgi:hypothetical protein
MFKLWFFFLFYIATSTQTTFAQSQPININTSIAFNSQNSLSSQTDLGSSNKVISKFNVSYTLNNASAYLALNYDKKNKYTLDGSYLQYTSGIATYGLGSIDRNWSFSNKTSLILSHNARPMESIYLKLKNKFGYKWLPSNANWSFEAFNGYSEGSLNNSKSMLMGLRTIISPTEGLNFEIVQTSQWGGKNYSQGLSALGAALFFDTNDSSNANINKMVGFGVSYLMPNSLAPFRIYGQAVGEDEAGNLPSCYTYLAGAEWTHKKNRYPSTVGIEIVDTRIDTTTNGNCGPNTMYNNHIYSYTNYGKTMGAGIDTEGSSLSLFIQSKLSQEVTIEFSTKLITINDNDWTDHRLSSKRQSGLINSMGISWIKNKIMFNGNIYNQSFNLDNADIKSGLGFGFSSSITF